MAHLDSSIRRDLARAALSLAGSVPWREVTLIRLADAAARPVSDFYGATLWEAVDCVEEAFDRAIADDLNQLDPNQSVRDRLFIPRSRRVQAGPARQRECGLRRVLDAFERTKGGNLRRSAFRFDERHARSVPNPLYAPPDRAGIAESPAEYAAHRMSAHRNNARGEDFLGFAREFLSGDIAIARMHADVLTRRRARGERQIRCY